MLIKHGKNIHQLNVEGKHFQIAMLSDIHWDNPKCDWDYLKKHLDYCLENNILIHINGDMFCLMQGRGDNRRNKSDIRPEHNNAKYLDSIVETAVEWWSPYAHLLTVIGYGNHETGIIKYQETDILQRFVDLLNYKNKTNVYTGGYGGWLIINQMYRSNCRQTSRIKYFHGSGGGGVVTKGALNLTRALEMYEDFDVFTMGHIHENSSRNDVREMIKFHSQKGYEIKHKDIHLMLTGTYKEEYGDGSHGWHVERGAPVKPVGGRILDIRCDEYEKDKKTFITKIVDSRKFPI
jgi:hypothetical protein